MGTLPRVVPRPGTLAISEPAVSWPWVYRPAAGEALDYFGYVNLPAVGASARILSFTVPTGRSGVINRIGNELRGLGWNDGDPGLTWTLSINNLAPATYGVITVSLGTIALPGEMGGIRLRENDLVVFAANNASLAAASPVQRVGARLVGWFYPKRLDPTGIW